MSLTSQIRYARALDTTSLVGAGKTGLAFGDITAKYLVEGGVLAALTTETITTLGEYQAPTSAAHVRIKELSNADPCKGIYEIHFHNDQVAAAGKRLWLFLSASGALFDVLSVDLLANTLADGAISDASFTVPAAAAAIAGPVGMLQRLYRRLMKRAVKGATTITMYADDGTTPIVTQTISEAGGTQVQGAET